MDPSPTNQNQVVCVNCQAVTTADGKTVWVCENCGAQNQPAVTPAPVAPAFQAVQEPVAPPVPDANQAQADIDSAAATVSPVVPEIPTVGLNNSASPIMGGSAPPMPPGPVIGK